MNYAYAATTSNNIIGSLLPKSFWSEVFLYGLLYLFISILIFLIGRQIVLWYWRINENTETLKDISLSLKNISIAMQKIEHRGRSEEEDLIGVTKIEKKENREAINN